MKEKTIIIFYLLCIVIGLFIGFMSGMQCNYFQKKTFTDESDKRGTYFELCIKAQTATNTAGGNVKSCDAFKDDLTTSGRLNNFKLCVDYVESNKSKIAVYPKFNCYEIIFGESKNEKN